MIIVSNDNFTMDLSPYQVQFIERNNWFQDQLFESFTVPLRVPIEEYFEVYRYYTEESYEAIFDVILNRYGKLYPAVLEITGTDGIYLEIEIRFGIDQFPNWDKKLADLPLEQKTVTDIRLDATSVINKNYPESNYQFPKIYTDYYDLTNRVWQSFKGFYNNFSEGVFLANSIDLENNIVYNNNIMRPMPYNMHILKTGIEDAGFTLEGEILNDNDFLKSVAVPTNLITVKTRPETIEFLVGFESFIKEGFNNRYGEYGFYRSTQQILHYGQFRIKGSVKQSGLREISNYEKMFLDGVQLFERAQRNDYTFDIMITTKPEGSELFFEKFDYQMTENVLDCEIIPLRLFDENGEEIVYNSDSNVIDLRLHVNDMTFGQYVQKVMSLFNYDFTPGENRTIIMNKKSELISPNNGLNFEWTEVEKPVRTFNSGQSYLLKYPEVKEPYTFKSLFVDKNGPRYENFTTNDRTNEILIDVIPLPWETNATVLTSRIITDDVSCLALAIYEASAISNTTQNITPFLMESVYGNNYRIYIDFLLKSVVYKWNFNAPWSDLAEMSVRSKLFAYENYHIIKEVSRKRITEEEEQVELETYSVRR